MSKPVNTPVVLIVRDGWGENPNPSHDSFNAVKLARTPVNDRLRAEWAWTLVKTSGEDVGLPDGTMGNSEVGHQNIGAGRIVEQESRVITRAMKLGFHEIPAVRNAIERELLIFLNGIRKIDDHHVVRRDRRAEHGPPRLFWDFRPKLGADESR